MVSADRFEELVGEALDGLPEWVRMRLDNVVVVVEDHAPRSAPGLLGLYHGVPQDRRGVSYTNALPDRITLFRDTIEAAGDDDAALRRRIARTVAHEIAHHFGISDERLREIGAY